MVERLGVTFDRVLSRGIECPVRHGQKTQHGIGALYAATKHAIEGYSESLDHELRTKDIRVSVIEPAYTKTPFDANFLEPDAKLDEYREIRAAVNREGEGSDGNCGTAWRRG